MTQASSLLEKTFAIRHYWRMAKVIEQILKMMPIWFGIGFLGSVLAELYLRTPLQNAVPLSASNEQIYIACMIFGGLYGIFAWRFGRWI